MKIYPNECRVGTPLCPQPPTSSMCNIIFSIYLKENNNNNKKFQTNSRLEGLLPYIFKQNSSNTRFPFLNDCQFNFGYLDKLNFVN